MLFKLISRQCQIHRAPIRAFSSVSKDEFPQFPYKFGNTAMLSKPPYKDSFVELMEVGAHFKGLTEGARLAYRALLTSIQEQDLGAIKTMVEKRLYKRLEKDIQEIKDKGYTFALHNTDNEVNVKAKDYGFVIGGCLDRAEEHEKGLKAMKLMAPRFVIYMPNMMTGFDFNADVLIKFKAEIRTSYKLDLKDAKGEGLLTPDELSKEELHEITLEGKIDTKELGQVSMLNIMSVSKTISKNGFKIKDAIIVDLDEALKGNLHKDCDYL